MVSENTIVYDVKLQFSEYIWSLSHMRDFDVTFNLLRPMDVGNVEEEL